MIKNRFYKNLYQSLSWGGSAVVLIVPLLLGYFESLTYDEFENSWLWLIFCLGIICLFFLVGFYRVFQMVEIDKYGIQVKILGKTIRMIGWGDVVAIEEKTVMKNPAYVVMVRDQECLNLDKRKKILRAIRFYADREIEVRHLRPKMDRSGNTGQ